MNIKIEVVDKIKNYLIDKINPKFIFLFGSAVEGNFRDDSDIDIAFFTKKRIGAYDLFLLKSDLEVVLNREVDLINLYTTTTVLKSQIVGKGIVIYSINPIEEAEFKIRVLKEYALLNEERREILERIKREGTIYG